MASTGGIAAFNAGNAMGQNSDPRHSPGGVREVDGVGWNLIPESSDQYARGYEEGRSGLEGLRSNDERSLSLREALSRIRNDLGFDEAIDFRVFVDGSERHFPDGLRVEVYRIGREAIENAVRHSRATNIEIKIEYRATALRILVRDNGRGIYPQNLPFTPNRHFGLKGMRQRAQRIGGRLRILSCIRGTELELYVPF